FSPISPPSLPDAAGKFAGSFIGDSAIQGRIADSLAPIEEGAFEAMYNQHQQQFQVRTPHDSPSSNTTEPASRRTMSNLSKQLQNHVPTTTADQFDYYMATSPSMNTGSFVNSYDQAAGSSLLNHFLARSVNGQQDAFSPMKTDEGFEFNILSPIALSPQTPAWATGGTQPMGLPSNRSPGCTSSMNGSSLRSHPYSRGSSSLITASDMSPMSTISGFAPATGQGVPHILPHQQAAAQKICEFMQARPKAAIPASLITTDLAEIRDGRGWCLIGNCGIDRAAKKINPLYDVTKDGSRKRLDHLYDHIRDKHFDNRPFRCPLPTCTQAFAREHDLKRHELTHQAQSLPCPQCDKVYTRNDNLKRHIQLKHSDASLPAQAPISMSLPVRSNMLPYKPHYITFS
ncbi:hypothetical protein M408DRAFT_296410, partial [Serendipita vermifera MAFF 305830]